MKHLLFAFVLMSVSVSACFAQKYKGHFINEELKFKMELNLYNDSILVPGMDYEHCYGYMQGNLNSTWVFLKIISLEDEKAVVRAVSDNGGDAQSVEIKVSDEKLTFRQIDEANIKTISGKKYVKLPKIVEMHR